MFVSTPEIRGFNGEEWAADVRRERERRTVEESKRYWGLVYTAMTKARANLYYSARWTLPIAWDAGAVEYVVERLRSSGFEAGVKVDEGSGRDELRVSWREGRSDG